jgi:hypothetical protein
MVHVVTATKPKPKPVDEENYARLSTTTGPEAREWFEAMLRRAKREGVFVVEAMLTASLARLLLDCNDNNRPVQSAQVALLCNDMRNGHFDGLNGQTIQISICGQLNDGQHRLHAKLESLTDFSTRFMFGLPRESRLTIDQGKQRTAGDYLSMEGFKQGASAAAIGVMLAQWEMDGTLRRTGGGSAWRLSRSEVAAFTSANYERIAISLQAIRPRPGISLVGGIGLLGFVHVILAQRHLQGATDFIDKLISGAELAENSPINVLRRRLTSEKRLQREEKLELILRAWNALRRGETPKVLPIHKRIPVIEN